MKPNQRSWALTVVLTAALAIIAARPCAAQTTWYVDTVTDDGSPTTLRAVLASAMDGDTIIITAGGTIQLNTDYAIGGPLVVDKSVTIIGPGQQSLTIDGGYQMAPMNKVGALSEVAPMNGSMPTGVPVFWVGFNWGDLRPDVVVSISGLTVAHGAHQVGGAIVNGGKLTLSQCTIRDNHGEYGGAIANLGTLELTDCALSNNVAAIFGGAILNGDVTWAGNATALTLTRCVLNDNAVTETGWGPGGGAIANVAWAATATASVNESTFTRNSAQLGGAIYNLSLGDSSAIPAVPAFAVVSILRSTLDANSAVAASSPALGGAIFQATGEPTVSIATVTADRSTFSENSAISPASSSGGAIFNDFRSSGSVILRNSTLVNNSALLPEVSLLGEPQWAIGGAIAAGGTVSVDNSTFSGNEDAGGPSFPVRAGGILVVSGGNLTIKNSILANDVSGPNIAAMPADADIPAGTVNDLGFNVCTDDGSGLLVGRWNLLNTDPRLGPLAKNGGPTWTCALLNGSPAIDAADSLDSSNKPVKQDQRGMGRPQGAANDAGAFEAKGASPPVWPLDIAKASVTSPSPRSPNIMVTVMLSNANQAAAYDVAVTAARLDGVETNSSLPLEFGVIKPGASKKCTLQFKDVASGEQVLRVYGTSSLGCFSTTQKVDVP